MMIPPKLSLEERVNIAHRRLVLIVAATIADPDATGVDTDELLSAINELADEAADAIEPIRHAPANVASWQPTEAEA